MKRQTCSNCLRTVGTLPGGEERPYRSERYIVAFLGPRSWHYCLDEEGCTQRRAARAM